MSYNCVPNGTPPMNLSGLFSVEERNKAKELDKLQKSERIEEKNFVDKMTRIINLFVNNGFSQDNAVQLAIAFYKDPALQKKRAKRKSAAEIITEE